MTHMRPAFVWLASVMTGCVAIHGHPEVTVRATSVGLVMGTIVDEFVHSGWRVDGQTSYSATFLDESGGYENRTVVNVTIADGLCHITATSKVRRRDVVFGNWVNASAYFTRATERVEVLPLINEIGLKLSKQ